MLETWEEEPHQKKSKINSENSSSNPDGLGSHHHTSGAKPHICVAHEMAVEAGGVSPPIIVVVCMIHTRKDGTCIDKRAENLVKAAEVLALERSQSSSLSPSTPSSEDLTVSYIETAKNNKGRVYSFGLIQYLESNPNEVEPISLIKAIETDARITKMEESMAGIKQGMEIILRLNGIDPVTYQPLARESAASAPSLYSESSQQIKD